MFTTDPLLLAEVKESDDAAWSRFRDTYRPLIFHCAERNGVPASGYLELEQDVMVAFFHACGKFEYDPARGRFRSYLGTLVRNCIVQRWRNEGKSTSPLDTGIDSGAEDEFEKNWEREWRLHCFWMAMRKVKEELPEKTVAAFELCDLKHASPQVAAAALKVSLATLYNYRKKVLTELKRYVGEHRDSEWGDR